MKFFFILSAICLFSNLVISQPVPANSKTIIYLVRHAEKENGKDPVLTTAGKQRAGDLLQTLRDKHIARIYVSQYLRTQMTADSLRIQLGIDTIHYTADTAGENLFKKITLHSDWGKTILVIGHSNTVLRIIAHLGVINADAPDIPDNEFDNLFLVKYKKDKASLTKTKYGTPSKAAATVQPMH